MGAGQEAGGREDIGAMIGLASRRLETAAYASESSPRVSTVDELKGVPGELGRAPSSLPRGSRSAWLRTGGRQTREGGTDGRGGLMARGVTTGLRAQRLGSSVQELEGELIGRVPPVGASARMLQAVF